MRWMKKLRFRVCSSLDYRERSNGNDIKNTGGGLTFFAGAKIDIALRWSAFLGGTEANATKEGANKCRR